MATIGTTMPTLVDIAKEMDPDGKPAHIIPILAQVNPILEDAPFYEGNLPEGHQVSVDSSLPSGSVSQYNQGTASTKGTAAQFVEQAAMFDIWSKVDARIPRKFGEGANAWRVRNGRRFIEGLSQTVATAMVYGNPASVAGEFRGLATRCNDLDGVNASNVIDCGGASTDNASILLVGYGPDQVFGFYPKGSEAGLRHEDHGKQVWQNAPTATASSGGNLAVEMDQWFWDLGWVVADWQFLVRACNIDVSNLRAMSGSEADLSDIMMQMQECLPHTNGVRPVFYMPRAVRTALRRQRRADVKAGGQLDFDVVDGKRIDYFDGIPIKTLDVMTLAEAEVTT